jgi:hypothetical protein
MDYTDLTRVRQALGGQEAADDDLLSALITRVSRTIDHKNVNMLADDYYARAAVAGEVLSSQNAVIDVKGRLICWPHKPVVESVAALSYRTTPLAMWQDVDTTLVEVSGNRVTSWISTQRQSMSITISYVGGFGDTVDDLPADLIEAATVLTVRFYKEVKSGLGDSIGVAELGTMQYTKAFPVRVLDMLKPFRRVEPW